MRELTLLETGYLSGLLLLALVLPLLLSFRGPQNLLAKKSFMRTVWAGQIFGAFAGLVVLSSARFAPCATACGLVGSMACTFVLLRQFRFSKQGGGCAC